ncbi:amino acid ABC transporter permease [Pseudomonas azerbaijanoccidentalis]|jgi:His/Glu/Gln/Arg/opine family amino acid ABC transporter permease subunit
MNSYDLLTLFRGTGFSLLLAIGSIPLATILSVLLVSLARSRFSVLRYIYVIYVWAIRGTPLLLLAMLIFYAMYAANMPMPPYVAGVFVVGVYHSSLLSEILRGAINAIPRSLFESAKTIGLPANATFTKILVPLVVRQALPAYINVCVMMIKASSILSVIGVWELTYASREITERTLDVFPVLGMAAAIYFVICFTADRFGKRLERRLAARGFAHELGDA